MPVQTLIKRHVKVLLLISTGLLFLLVFMAAKYPRDSHNPNTSDANQFKFTFAGDFGAGVNFKKTIKTIKNSGSAFTIALGDLGYGETTENNWCQTVKSSLGKDYPFELIVGNHDTQPVPRGNLATYTKCLPNHLPDLHGTYGQRYYFDYRGLARFILINPDIGVNSATSSYQKGSSNYRWVAAAIDDARANHIRWVVVGMHKNCLTIGVKVCEIGTTLQNLLLSKRVDIIIQGHEHGYLRTKQLLLGRACPALNPDNYDPDCISNPGTDRYQAGKGSIIVISGTGGKSLRKINLSHPAKPYFAAWNGSNVNPAYGPTIIKVSEDQLEVLFTDNDDVTQDHFYISRP